MWRRLMQASWLACLLLSIATLAAGMSVQHMQTPTLELTSVTSTVRVGLGFRGHRLSAWCILPGTKFVPWTGTTDFPSFGAATTSDVCVFDGLGGAPFPPSKAVGYIAWMPFWFPLAAFLSLALASRAFRLALARQRRRCGLCISCGYDLSGNESGVCSECGTACPQDA